jgi:hypothetical protein
LFYQLIQAQVHGVCLIWRVRDVLDLRRLRVRVVGVWVMVDGWYHCVGFDTACYALVGLCSATRTHHTSRLLARL